MSLKYDKKDIYSSMSQEEIDNVNGYSKSYMNFLDKARTEYLAVEEAVEILENNGFVSLDEKVALEIGDRVYFINKDKSLYVAVIGSEELVNGVNIVGAHIDSPRLDLKPMPLIEKSGAALLKTQYYGGIKKYQWMSIPLALYGVMYNKNGEKIKVAVGENEDDPVFTIADLLPHLAKDQMKGNANEFIDPEKMSVLVGSLKDKEADAKESEKVKANILKILNEKYGVEEIDFARSELSFVPAFKTKFIGFDRGLIGGYGQDDRVCAYATIRAIIDAADELDNVNRTMIAMIVDKEEIGSTGTTSMNSRAFDMFINKLIEKTNSMGVDKLEVYYNSKVLSADVTAGVSPEYEEVSDIQNGSMLGCGISIEKYTGSGGKYNASDANASYMSKVMGIFDRNNIMYQVGTLGKIGKGGGGTIAYILADKGCEVVDCGTPVLAMHSPYEVTSKFDVYMTYLAYKAFYKE
ncbi:MAG: aminopeptidase [Clostridia bacterium]|nr:aminopeptidase [Clostridia bacterium]